MRSVQTVMLVGCPLSARSIFISILNRIGFKTSCAEFDDDIDESRIPDCIITCLTAENSDELSEFLSQTTLAQSYRLALIDPHDIRARRAAAQLDIDDVIFKPIRMREFLLRMSLVAERGPQQFDRKTALSDEIDFSENLEKMTAEGFSGQIELYGRGMAASLYMNRGIVVGAVSGKKRQRNAISSLWRLFPMSYRTVQDAELPAWIGTNAMAIDYRQIVDQIVQNEAFFQDQFGELGLGVIFRVNGAVYDRTWYKLPSQVKRIVQRFDGVHPLETLLNEINIDEGLFMRILRRLIDDSIIMTCEPAEVEDISLVDWIHHHDERSGDRQRLLREENTEVEKPIPVENDVVAETKITKALFNAKATAGEEKGKAKDIKIAEDIADAIDNPIPSLTLSGKKEAEEYLDDTEEDLLGDAGNNVPEKADESDSEEDRHSNEFDSRDENEPSEGAVFYAYGGKTLDQVPGWTSGEFPSIDPEQLINREAIENRIDSSDGVIFAETEIHPDEIYDDDSSDNEDALFSISVDDAEIIEAEIADDNSFNEIATVPLEEEKLPGESSTQTDRQALKKLKVSGDENQDAESSKEETDSTKDEVQTSSGKDVEVRNTRHVTYVMYAVAVIVFIIIIVLVWRDGSIKQLPSENNNSVEEQPVPETEKQGTMSPDDVGGLNGEDEFVAINDGIDMVEPDERPDTDQDKNNMPVFDSDIQDQPVADNQVVNDNGTGAAMGLTEQERITLSVIQSQTEALMNVQIATQEKRFEDAHNILDALLAQSPMNPTFQLYMGRLKAAEGQVSSAIVYFKRVESSYSDKSLYWEERAMLHLRAGEVQNANQAFDRAIAIVGENTPEGQRIKKLKVR